MTEQTGIVHPALAERVRAHEQWYHSMTLLPGEDTPGWFDTRPALDEIPFPADLRGARCLDIATFDGFWAYTMEQRGADEVLAIDLLDDDSWDWPIRAAPEAIRDFSQRKAAGDGFSLASEVFGSSVERRELSIYDLDPDDVGMFDFVYLGSLLLHLKNPIGALERVRAVCRGSLLVVDAIDLFWSVLRPNAPVASLDGVGRPYWWKPNTAALARMVETAGFEIDEGPIRFLMPPGAGQGGRPGLRATPRLLTFGEGRQHLLRTWAGDPHAAVLAHPVG